MDNPVKAALNPNTVLRTAFIIIAVMAVAELLGITSYILAPISSIKGKFSGTSNG